MTAPDLLQPGQSTALHSHAPAIDIDIDRPHPSRNEGCSQLLTSSTYQDRPALHPSDMDDQRRRTIPVDDAVFRTVYDSPASLPGRYKWLTSDDDVRRIESLLGMPTGPIGAPLWLSGDEKSCTSCDRLISWLDIVSSSLAGVHSPEMIAAVILGDRKYVNTEVPRAIAGVRCIECSTAFESLRSFKCHKLGLCRRRPPRRHRSGEARHGHSRPIRPRSPVGIG